MEKIADEMCTRTQELEQEAQSKGISISNATINLTSKSQEQVEKKNYYSASSFCFNANIQIRGDLYQNISDEEIRSTLDMLSKLELKKIEKISPNNLQVHTIISDRLTELRDNIDGANKAIAEGDMARAREILAFARERAFSIKAWSLFFSNEGDEVKYDLKTSCIARVSDAEERLQYARLFAPISFRNIDKNLEDAKKFMNEGKYPECLSKAIEVNVQSNTILTTLGLTIGDLPRLVEKKLEFAKREIASQDYFPILAYSYYEYSNALKESDPSSALFYAEFAIEMANIDTYLSIGGNGNNSEGRAIVVSYLEEVSFVLLGLILGLVIGASVVIMSKRRK